MAEQLDLTSPIVPPSRTFYRISSLHLDWDTQRIRVVVRGSEEFIVTAEYAGATAVSLMSTLNTANLSINSLHKRVLQRLVADGFLPAGTVTGTPSIL